MTPLLAFNDLLAVFFQRFRQSVKLAQWVAGNDSHQQLIDALRDGNLNLACEILERHIRSHQERMGIA